MISRHILPTRRVVALAAVSGTLALAAGFAADAATAAAQTTDVQQAASENWAGYVAGSKTGQSFSSVSGSWVEPSVSAEAGEGYSAFWIGLGGASRQSGALEQVGTSADVVNGQTQYYAWYELVPAPETRLNLPIHPGDHMSARVTVNGTDVTVALTDVTTGQSVNKTLQMSDPDTSSAEWIAEAPSAVTQGGTQILPLADFGKVTFSNASATAGGHTGTISDPNWDVQEVQLPSTTGNGWLGGGGITPTGFDTSAVQGQSAAGATPSDLSSDGSGFSVSYADGGTGSQSSTGGQSASSTGGNGYGGSGGSGGGYGYPGGGYGYPGGGYGDSGGYPGGGYGYSGGGQLYVLPGGYALVF